MSVADFPTIVERLRGMLEPFMPHLTLQVDTPKQVELVLEGEKVIAGKERLDLPMFAIRTGKSYVSFYVYPLFTHPDDIEVPKSLHPRRQGRNCFNFSKPIDAIQFRDLNILLRHVWEIYVRDGVVKPLNK
jgi:hypothetical protein